MINVYNEFESSFIFFTSVTPKIKTKEFEFVKFFRSSKDCFTLELKKNIYYDLCLLVGEKSPTSFDTKSIKVIPFPLNEHKVVIYNKTLIYTFPTQSILLVFSNSNNTIDTYLSNDKYLCADLSRYIKRPK